MRVSKHAASDAETAAVKFCLHISYRRQWNALLNTNERVSGAAGNARKTLPVDQPGEYVSLII